MPATKSTAEKILEEMEKRGKQANGGGQGGAKPKTKGNKDANKEGKESNKDGNKEGNKKKETPKGSGEATPKDPPGTGPASTASGAPDTLERVIQVVQTQQTELDGAVRRLGICEDSILKIEKDNSDKALLLRGLPMTTVYERPDKTFDMVVTRLSNILRMHVVDEFNLVSAVRLGKGGSKRKGRFAYPAIKIVFYRPLDKHALLNRMPEINAHPDGKDLSFDRDMPNSKKEEEMAARQLAYQYRMENRGYKADPKLVGNKYVVHYRKKTEKSWTTLTWEEMKGLRERYDRAQLQALEEKRAENNSAGAAGGASASASASASANGDDNDDMGAWD